MRPRLLIPCVAPVALALCVGCFGGGGEGEPGAEAEAQSTEIAEATLGPVTAVVSLVPARPTLIDLIVLAIEVTYPEGVSIAPPPFSQAFEGRFLVRAFHERDAELGEDGRWRQRFEYSLEPEWSGESEVAGTRITFTDDRPDAGESRGEHELVLDAFTVNVEAVEVGAAPSPADLRAPAPPQPLPPEPWSPQTIAGVLATLLLFAVAAAWLVSRSRQPAPPPPPIPPRVLARSALDQLLRKELLQLGRVQQFYYELTAIVRRFVEGEYGLHAPEQTTEEFLGDLSRTEVLDRTLTTGLRAFLEAADLVKYAAQIPGEDAAAGSVELARNLINHEPEPMPERPDAPAEPPRPAPAPQPPGPTTAATDLAGESRS